MQQVPDQRQQNQGCLSGVKCRTRGKNGSLKWLENLLLCRIKFKRRSLRASLNLLTKPTNIYKRRFRSMQNSCFQTLHEITVNFLLQNHEVQDASKSHETSESLVILGVFVSLLHSQLRCWWHNLVLAEGFQGESSRAAIALKPALSEKSNYSTSETHPLTSLTRSSRGK